MSTHTLYHLDSSNYYTGNTSEAPLDKIATALSPVPKYLILRGTTDVAPPTPTDGTWPHWTGIEWELVESHKGEYIWIGNARFKCNYHGPLHSGDSLTPPVEIAEKVARADFKKSRAAAVSALTVTVEGLTFNADETSRIRMRDAADAAETLGSTVVPYWVLADDTVAYDIPVSTMRMAHAQAMVAMSSVWLPPAP